MFRRSIAISLALGLAGAAIPAQANDLLVAPTRVVLDGGRGAQVVLNNIGSVPATYRLSLILHRMSHDDFVEVPVDQATPAETRALSMISYAPRRVLLPPNQPQAVRIGARLPADLPDGEYRAHLLFRATPETAAAAAPAATQVRAGLSIQLIPVYGLSIPVIVRKGTQAAKVGIADVRRCKPEMLCMTLSRAGNRSVYGTVRAFRAGDSKPIAEGRGIAVYTETATRAVEIPLDATRATGAVTVEYVEDTLSGGATMATARAVLR